VLGDRPKAVATVTRILLDEIETLLCLERLRCAQHATPPSPRPRLGAVSFLHRFGSGLNRHAHLHAAVTDGVFLPGPHGPHGPPVFLPARPLAAADLAGLTERVRRRVIAFFKRQGFLDAHAAADMLAWEHSGFSIDASVRITLLPPQLRVYRQSLEHLLRYCARPPFALERLSVIRDADGRIARIRYVMPRRWIILWAATWVGQGRKRKSTQPGANGVIELSPFEFLDRLADLIPLMARVGEAFPLECPACGGDIRLIAFITKPEETAGRSRPTRSERFASGRRPGCESPRKAEPPPISPARGPPTDWLELVQVHDDRDVFQASPDELPAIDIHSL